MWTTQEGLEMGQCLWSAQPDHKISVFFYGEFPKFPEIIIELLKDDWIGYVAALNMEPTEPLPYISRV